MRKRNVATAEVADRLNAARAKWASLSPEQKQVVKDAKRGKKMARMARQSIGLAIEGLRKIKQDCKDGKPLDESIARAIQCLASRAF